MTNKTTEKFFTEEFLQDLLFLIENINIEEYYNESIISTATFNDPYGYKCNEDLEDLFIQFQDLLEYTQETINDYFNINMSTKGLYNFLYENQNTEDCDLEAKFNECLEEYFD